MSDATTTKTDPRDLKISEQADAIAELTKENGIRKFLCELEEGTGLSNPIRHARGGSSEHLSVDRSFL